MLGDGAIVARYRRDLPATDQRAVARWLRTAPALAVFAAPTGRQPDRAISVHTFQRTLKCIRLDFDQMTAFRDRWLKQFNYG